MTSRRKLRGNPAIETVRSLRLLRAAGWTFQQIGDLVGVSRQAVHQWLRCAVQTPDQKPFVKTLIKRRKP